MGETEGEYENWAGFIAHVASETAFALGYNTGKHGQTA